MTGSGRPISVFRAAVLALAFPSAFAADPLPAYDADPGAVTVSGVSSGGFMAVQFHVAHSGAVKGAGVIAGGPYWCARGSALAASTSCMAPGWWTPLPRVELLKAEADRLARGRQIDPTANLAAARVWLFSGSKDTTVAPAVVDALRRFYSLHEAAILSVTDKPAGHAMVTERAGNACGTSAAPFINDCGFDAAGELLKHLLGPLAAPAGKEGGRLIQFDQKAFAGDAADTISLAERGYAYVPQACESGRCRVHVAFHGCRQGAGQIGERFVREAGYNRWADGNRLILLYPQVVARAAANPFGCWDWWGYTGAQYHTKAGPQLRAVKAMLDRLASPRR